MPRDWASAAPLGASRQNLSWGVEFAPCTLNVRLTMPGSRELLIAVCLLASPATLAATPQSFSVAKKADCRELQPYLAVAKAVASRNLDTFSAFLRARPKAFECYASEQGVVMITAE